VPNPFPGGNCPWQVYHTVRNSLVKTCRRFGPTGPIGTLQIIPNVEDLNDLLVKNFTLWESGDPDPMYYILDDQLNSERYCYAELYGNDPFNAGWVLAIAQALKDFDGWGLGVQNIPDSFILIFCDRLLVNGRLAWCQTASQVVEEADRLLKRGNKKWWQF
jgi:hypothetical protein